MKDIYIEKKCLVINEELFIPIYSYRLRYIEDKEDVYDTVKDISVDDIRSLIQNHKMNQTSIKKSVIKKEEIFCFREELGPVKIPSKKIQRAYISTIYTKCSDFTLDDLKKKLPTEDWMEYCKDNELTDCAEIRHGEKR